jgi:murein DD-endopeptidase MepM/ murein hydrolase activator NlpD
MQIPVHGKVISPFGYRGRHRHTGTDIKLHKGDAVRAAVSGVVTMAASFYGYGNLIILKHSNNVETYYSHLSKCIVHVGDSVVAGAVIGLGGRTGRATTDHLHFEIRFNKVAQNAQKYFDFSNNKIKESIYANIPEIKAKKNKEHEVNVADTKINASKDFVIIQKGDTLNSIAQNMGTSVEQLQELNQIQSAGLMPGMKLKIK